MECLTADRVCSRSYSKWCLTLQSFIFAPLRGRGNAAMRPPRLHHCQGDRGLMLLSRVSQGGELLVNPHRAPQASENVGKRLNLTSNFMIKNWKWVVIFPKAWGALWRLQQGSSYPRRLLLVSSIKPIIPAQRHNPKDWITAFSLLLQRLTTALKIPESLETTGLLNALGSHTTNIGNTGH